MNAFAQRENIRMLAATAGIAEEHAAELLNATAVITYESEDTFALHCAKHIEAMLGRTLRNVSSNAGISVGQVAVEIIIGNADPRFDTARVFVSAMDEEIVIGPRTLAKRRVEIHPVGILLGACYATAAALKAALGELLPFRVPDALRVNLSDLLGPDLPLLYKPIPIGQTHLVGAGAIGNGFISGLSQFDVDGTLRIVDDDAVGAGNLQRCLLFEERHLNKSKAEILAEAASKLLPNLKVVPHNVRLEDLPSRKAGAWLGRLVVGVDSPRARRSLQSEFPGEVFDASTTGIHEVVLHFHKQPTAGACLGCVYPHSPQENAHEVHVAETLGVSLAEVRESRISSIAAERICRRYPALNPSELISGAYDSLFKALCSTQSLKTSEDRQVLTPFAFVSVLAGTFMAIEFVRRLQRGHDGLFNEWRISPWSNPVLRRRRALEKNPSCEFCNDPILADVVRAVWSEKDLVEIAS